MKLLVGFLLPPLILLPVTARADWPPGQVFDDGITLDVTPSGFQALGDGLPGIVPPGIDLPADANGYNIHQADSGTCCDPVFGWICWTCWEYDFGVSNGFVGLDVHDLQLVPQSGYLQLSIDTSLWVNASNDPMAVDVYAEGGINDIGLSIPIDFTCDAWADPFEITMGAPVYLSVVDTPDGRQLRAHIPAISWNMDLSGNDLHLSGCGLGDFIDFVQNVGGLFGFDPIGAIIDLLHGTIDTQIQALIPQIEGTIQDAFAQARVQQSVDLGGTTLDVLVEPYDVQVTPDGARVQLAGSFDAPEDPCVADYGFEGSRQSPVDLPPIGSAPSEVPAPADMGLLVSDDLVNSGLFAAWRAGLLCQDLTQTPSLPLNTSLLTLLSRDAYGDLFDQTSPLEIVTRPARPPEGRVDGPSDLTVEVRNLGVDLYADLDGRRARLLGTDVQTDVGLDFGFAGSSGQLDVGIDLDPAAIDAQVTYDEITTAHTQEIQDAMGGLFETVLPALLGDTLSGVTFPVPSLQGFGLTDLVASPAGDPADYLGLYGYLGPVGYQSSGGCGSASSCGGGCQTGGGPGGLVALIPALLVLVRRRRR